MKHWTYKYLNITYKRMACAPFVEFILRDHFKIDYKFPQSQGNVFEKSNLIKNSIPLFAEPTKKPFDGCLVLMNGTRLLCHVGIYVNINGESYVFHTESTMKTAALHRIKDLSRYGYTLEGFYKWLK